MICPSNIEQKGSKGEIHDGRPNEDHEAEMSKVGEEKGILKGKQGSEPHEKIGDTHEEEYGEVK